MKRFALAALMACIGHTAFAADASHWGYTGAEGPDQWAKLSPDNYACNGKNQSPVDKEGRIWLNPQAWSILGGAASAEQRETMLAQVDLWCQSSRAA
eukprot:gene36475-41280_t